MFRKAIFKMFVLFIGCIFVLSLIGCEDGNNDNEKKDNGGSTILSNDASLQSIEVNEGTLFPTFSPTILSYTMTAPNNIINISATTADSKATITSNPSILIGVPLNIGNNVITFTVVAEDGTTNVYTVTIIRGVIIPGFSLLEKLDWLSTNSTSNTEYSITLTDDNIINPRTLLYSGKNDIIIQIKGDEKERIITSTGGAGSIFKIGLDVTLILEENITLQSHGANIESLITVERGGTLIMNTGSMIIGNNVVINNTDGVIVNGDFIMNGGKIIGNTGNGVSILNGNGNFTMNGGDIIDNAGNGVRMSSVGVSNNIFTMNGGKIISNTSNGVSISNSTFIMNRGEISGNFGDGVISGLNGNFTMNGGMILNNHENGVRFFSGSAVASIFTMNGGEISGNTFSGVSLFELGNFRMYNGEIFGNSIGVRNLYGSFSMFGGIIFGNTNIVISTNSGGGGVYVQRFRERGSFTKTGGTITGYTEGDDDSNIVKNNLGVVNNQGHAVFFNNMDLGIIRRRETTAGPGVNLSTTSTANWGI
jgi:hypothetical protein